MAQVCPISAEGTLTPDALARQLTHLPSAPKVLPKLKRLLGDGNSSLHEVVSLVRLDPGIAARVLQVGNSAFYSHGIRCYTVEDAVHRVGYDHVYELVSTAVAAEVLVRPLEVYSLEADELWQSSVTCAVAAETLADIVGIDRDIAYTIGLMHRVGMVAINDWLTRGNRIARFECGNLPLECIAQERSLLGFNNAEVGGALLRLWEFPPAMSEPVRWQYAPLSTAAHCRLASLLSLSKWIRNQLSDAGGLEREVDAELLKQAGVPASRLVPSLERVRGRISEIQSMLEEPVSTCCRVSFPAGFREIYTTRS